MSLYIHKKITELRENWKKAAMFALLFLIFYLLALRIPPGFDWRIFFSQGNIPKLWTPWAGVIVKFLNLPLLIAITLTSVVIRTYRYNHSLLPAILACVSLPTLWLVFLGNLDGIVLLGLLLLPFGAPLVLLKPQIAAFALLAKRSYLIAGAIWFVISILIWGFWPLNFLVITRPGWAAEWVQDITLFPWGLLIALPLLWLSRKDEDLLMIAGSFATPHLFPYHFAIVMPALGRMSKKWMAVAWLFSWSPLLANWLGNPAWHFGNLFALVLWCGVYFNQHPVRLPLPKPAISDPGQE